MAPLFRCQTPPPTVQSWLQPSSQKEGLGFPCMKLAGIFSLASGGLEGYAAGTLHQHESILFRSLWERLEKGDLMLGEARLLLLWRDGPALPARHRLGAAAASSPQSQFSGG